MKDTAHLVISQHGIVRMTKRQPTLCQGEIGVLLAVAVPNEVFIRPRIRASISIDDDQVPPVEIDAGVLDGISENIRQGLGVEVALTVVEPEDEE